MNGYAQFNIKPDAPVPDSLFSGQIFVRPGESIRVPLYPETLEYVPHPNTADPEKCPVFANLHNDVEASLAILEQGSASEILALEASVDFIAYFRKTFYSAGLEHLDFVHLRSNRDYGANLAYWIDIEVPGALGRDLVEQVEVQYDVEYVARSVGAEYLIDDWAAYAYFSVFLMPLEPEECVDANDEVRLCSEIEAEQEELENEQDDQSTEQPQNPETEVPLTATLLEFESWDFADTTEIAVG